MTYIFWKTPITWYLPYIYNCLVITWLSHTSLPCLLGFYGHDWASFVCDVTSPVSVQLILSPRPITGPFLVCIISKVAVGKIKAGSGSTMRTRSAHALPHHCSFLHIATKQTGGPYKPSHLLTKHSQYHVYPSVIDVSFTTENWLITMPPLVTYPRLDTVG